MRTLARNDRSTPFRRQAARPGPIAGGCSFETGLHNQREKEHMNRHACLQLVILNVAIALAAAPLAAEPFQLLTGRDAGLTPGAARAVFPSGPPSIVPGTFFDGDRLAGTAGTAPATYAGTGTPLLSPNTYGALSFMFRRGSIPLGSSGRQPVLTVDFLGGPLLDLDGDLLNGSRRLTPQAGQTPVEIPGTRSFINLGVDVPNGDIALNHFDSTSTNQGFQGFGPGIAAAVNTLAGTSLNGAPGSAINPSVDTRQGALSLHAPDIYRVTGLGYEFWQDSIDPTSSTAATLGTFQYLGGLSGWYVQRDGSGNFPTLAGAGLGSTPWPLVNTSAIGGTFNQTGGPPATITGGPTGDNFAAPNNGGLPLSDFGGDLGAWLDAVVVPLIDPLSRSFVYLDSAGFGMNNSFDPVFADTIGYDVVLVAQSAPIPEPSAIGALAAAFLLRRRLTPTGTTHERA
jgi:hypothetical protein